ncbi:MAG: tRNA (N6-threonylcarbamoyladenosine(37)-N6)-methyltransferase TrmO [Candidatus Eisenbacteria bacterium]|nr:tRNA (N6-threonylcarbamoyladenosine(37)-N6)-methyltransferase TrmO [Candidatus Eisenbacteria bacterium]
MSGDISLKAIGVVRTANKTREETPVQPSRAVGIEGTVEVFPEYEKGLDGLERFSHVFLICCFDRAGPAELTVTPHGRTERRGVFATRAPDRPNPIGLSLVRLLRREGTVLHVSDVDILDGTPLLDVKPYVAELDSRND